MMRRWEIEILPVSTGVLEIAGEQQRRAEPDTSPRSTRVPVYGGFVKQIAQTALAAAAIVAGAFALAGCGGGSMQMATAEPTFTPPAGTYATSQQVTVGDTTDGAVLYCSTDGGAPSASSPQCSEPMTVAKSETLRAVAIAPGMKTSPVAVAAYTISESPAPTPTFSPGSGSFTSAQTVAIGDSLADASIYYTTDGSAPTTSSTLYTGPVAVSSTETLSAIATASGYGPSGIGVATYTITLPAMQPVFSEPAGTYTSVQTIAITDPTPNAVIYYTTDGTQPTIASPKYSGAITVAQTETINAVAVAPGYSTSAVASAAYVINLPATATPVFSPAAGLYSSAQTVTLSDATPGAAIYYTTNGSPATTSSTIYSGPVTVAQTETLNAVAAAQNYGVSQDASAVYTINPPAQPPTFSPGTGTYTTIQNVVISDTTPGATIYYTTNGSPATTSSTVYSGPIAVSATESINAIASAPNYSASTNVAASYTINLPSAAAPVISPDGGTFGSSQVPVTVKITDATPGAAIYYTTDGSTPTTSSTLYSGAISVSFSETIAAIAAAYNYANSAPVSAVFTVNQPQAATPAFSEGTGTYTSAQTVTISDSTALATIYYTTDGSPATTSSTVYSGAITVSSTETINAIASAPGYNLSADAQATYTLNLTPAPAPTFSPSPGVYSSAQTVTISDSAANSTIYYTTNGNPATTASTVYSGAITVSSTETLNAVATASGYGVSSDASGAYTISTGPVISGAVSSGSLPIAGATVQVYAAGTSGYGAGATAVTNPAGGVTTDAGGHFSVGFSCAAAPGDQLYLVATGGAAGTNSANTAIALMTAVGSCNSTSFPASVTINEVTTVASTYALAGFSSLNASGGILVGAPAPAATCTSAGVTTEGGSTCNYIGLANAFRTMNNLVNATGATDVYGAAAGAARTITPFYTGVDPRNPNGWSSTYGDPAGPDQIQSTDNPVPQATLNTSTVPQARINALADILASCVESDGSGCSSGLFSAATPAGGTAPADTLQAALNIAQNPGSNGVSVATLLGLVASSSPPYPTTLNAAAAPDDLTLALTFTGGGLGIDPSVDSNDALTDYALSIDVAGNIWVGASPYSPSSTWSGGQGLIAGFDSLGEALTPPTSDPGGAVYQDADTLYSTFGGYGPDVLSSAVGGGTIPGQFQLPTVMAIDPSERLWISDNAYSISGDVIYQGGELAISAKAAPGSTTNLSAVEWSVAAIDSSMAIDGSGDVWATATTGGGIYGNTSSLSTIGPYTVNSTNQCGVAIDSLGLLWVTDCGANNQAFAVNASTGVTGATISGVGGGAGIQAGVGGGSVGMLAAGANGDLFGCNANQSGYVVLDAAVNASAPVSTFTTPNGRCGSYLTLDGAGHLWSYGSYGTSPNLTYVLDEVNPSGSGTQITPDTGFTGTSSGEITATGLTTINGSAFPAAGMAIDASGNLWFLNGALDDDTGTSPGNALVEFVGVAAPTITPASVAVQNTAQGTRP
jgi:hypothetical protein